MRKTEETAKAAITTLPVGDDTVASDEDVRGPEEDDVPFSEALISGSQDDPPACPPRGTHDDDGDAPGSASFSESWLLAAFGRMVS